AQPEPKPYTTGVISHILLSILSYSVFTLAAFQAVLLHKQNHALKQHISGKFLNSLPPLQTMERLLFEMLWTGFIILSAALITGLFFVDNIVTQHLVHKSFLSLVSWSIFAVLLFGRNFWGWRGQRAIHWTIGGFISLMLGFFGSKLVLEIFISTS
ncbi:MAG: cytochrome c biogenesis protein CcsA, partial [Oceanospirillaceae bacterium]